MAYFYDLHNACYHQKGTNSESRKSVNRVAICLTNLYAVYAPTELK
jgi:hypothetical protein